jgi:hypothetical protein
MGWVKHGTRLRTSVGHVLLSVPLPYCPVKKSTRFALKTALTCLDAVEKKPCEKRRKTGSFHCEKERKPCTFFNRTIRSGYDIHISSVQLLLQEFGPRNRNQILFQWICVLKRENPETDTDLAFWGRNHTVDLLNFLDTFVVTLTFGKIFTRTASTRLPFYT